jgi:hypothetical protein
VTIRQLCAGLTAIALLVCAVPADAQIRSATITGTVADTTGAVFPGAAVSVTNQDTNASVELVTSDAGIFTAPYLPAGAYTVAVTLSGFAAFKQTNIPLETGQTVRIAVEMKLNAVGETVEVVGAHIGGRGNTNLTNNPGAGQIAGSASAATFGRRNMNTYNPRQMQMRLAFRF